MEFMVRHPASECVVASAPDHVPALAETFPKVLFHAFGRPQDPSRVVANLICHPVPFDAGLAAAFAARGTPFNLIFNGDEMTHQMALHLRAAPTCSFMLLTDPPGTYLGGELLFPLWCRRDSCLAALVPSADNRAFDYDPGSFVHALRAFHDERRRDDAYDQGAETAILRSYGRLLGGSEGTADVLGELLRVGLPPADRELCF
jgi:hypothetical protein